jgi:hypothetical protein
LTAAAPAASVEAIGKEVASVERTDLRKVLAGFGLATLLAGVAVSGCAGGQKSS